ncbi:MAG TPA: folylpolyglutamate synthase/dihydrofolate synthase family protein [Saprospiraceae bacterium]|nr:folylpolyglutamate synthase/dihydrofolate synthase family protein [Saprospiraceae bacterium]HMQ83551.1 folylpolyglutamate synthase/dihydrofolate synthase family protein [Saprospiraceae bacterium]
MKSRSNYKETLAWLFHQLPMFQRIGPKAFKNNLDNSWKLAELTDYPERKFPSIHIAGTNGKGSTSHFIAAMLQAAGYKTGLYTSPHYKDYRERIKINGVWIDKDFVVDFVQRYRADFEAIQPSYFELSVAMAFAYFAHEKIDLAVIETGLGGRLDSTNIISPVLSVITNISYDHQAFLGETLPEIAGEKAGIIKKGIPVVIGKTQAETQAVFTDKARQMEAPISFADQILRAEKVAETPQHAIFDIYQNDQRLFAQLSINAKGPYQAENLLTSLQAIRALPPRFSIAEQHIREGLENLVALTKLQGRWQVLQSEPMVLCDSAHNEAGIAHVVAALQQIPHRRLHFVIGVVNDKKPDKVLQLLPKAARYYFAKANIPRGMDASELMATAQVYRLKGRAYASVRNALHAAKRQAAPDDLIFIGGSIFVVAEVL